MPSCSSSLSMNERDAVDQQIETLVRENFHLRALYPYQELVIHSILERGGLYGSANREQAPKHQLVILPTGSGKSVCFLLPALLLPGITLIIYPLLSLMSDQARRVAELGQTAIVLRGGQSNAEREDFWRILRNNQARIIITNPEMLEQATILEVINTLPISLVVIDEVHTVVQWGLSFRPAYLRLAEVLAQLKCDQIVAFTATASDTILTQLRRILFRSQAVHLVRGNPDRPNIVYRAVPTLSPLHDLELLLAHQVQFPAIVFCSSRQRCEDLAWQLSLRLRPLDVRYYHAGLDKAERSATERWFFHSTDGLLVATSAYGMGVDKKGIRTTIHYDIPSDVESFLQESGRSGRDGQRALALLFIHKSRKGGGEELFDIFTQTSSCRRLLLLAKLGFQADYCAGCDVCDGTVEPLADGEFEIMRLVTFNPFRWTPRLVVQLLTADPAQNNPFLFEHPWWGLFRYWRPQDLEVALRELLSTGAICQAKHWPCKEKLYLPLRSYFRKDICCKA